MSEASDQRCDSLPANTVRPLRGIDRDELRDWSARRGHRLAVVDLAGSGGKAGVLANIARAFEFPVWFGMNLDALYDALTDLPLPEGGSGFTVLLSSLSRVADFDAEQRTALLDVFRDATKNFAERSIPFRVLYS
jgi:RNAse (barnase) inhibitor barstar